MVDDVLTARLLLRPTDPGDAEELFPIFSDPAGWWYSPASRHVDLARTREWLTRSAQRWRDDGLSYWTVRLADSGRTIGVGGVQRQRTRAWNVNYRVAGDVQGRGLAGEVAAAAVMAAHATDDTVPVMAWIVGHNAPSRRVAERAGLVDRGEFADPSDGQMRHAYTDRDPAEFFARHRSSRNNAAAATTPPSA